MTDVDRPLAARGENMCLQVLPISGAGGQGVLAEAFRLRSVWERKMNIEKLASFMPYVFLTSLTR